MLPRWSACEIDEDFEIEDEDCETGDSFAIDEAIALWELPEVQCDKAPSKTAKKRAARKAATKAAKAAMIEAQDPVDQGYSVLVSDEMETM